jgi:outer membrane protein TolC
MKQLLLVFVVLCTRSISAQAASCTSQDVEFAKNFVKEVETRFDAGTVPYWEISEAKSALRDVQLCAQELDLNTYCNSKLLILKDMLESVQSRFNAGLATATSVAAVIRQRAEIKTKCQ